MNPKILETLKQEQRTAARALRNRIDVSGNGEKAAYNFLNSFSLDATATISLYLPIGSEIDTLPLIHKLTSLGITCALPVIVGKGLPLIFREWSPNAPVEKGDFKTSAPNSDAREVTPQIIVTPLLAFDEDGFRMGYGGGFYDRTLERLRSSTHCNAVGYAFEAQLVDKIVIDQYDQKMDWIVTDQQVRKFS